ncbi:MAG: ATP-binding protein [Egibacteraceae bacterium]
MRVDHVHGNLVTIMRQDERPRVERRASPAHLLPRRAQGFLDRTLETGRAIAAVAEGEPIEFCGPPGFGKSSLLRHLAHHPGLTVVGGVAHLPSRRQALDDLLQSLFGVFYECDTLYKPNGGALRHYLNNADALILLDDIELGREELEELLDFAPACRFVTTSSAGRVGIPQQSVALPGLPEDDALALITRGLGRSLADGEQAAARRLSRAVRGSPLQLLQAVALVDSSARSLASVADEIDSLTPQAMESVARPDRKLLAALAVVPGLLLDAELVHALTGLPQAQEALEGLAGRGLAQAHPVFGAPTRYGVPDEVGHAIRESWDINDAAHQVQVYFAEWAKNARGGPDPSRQDVEAGREVMQWAAEAGAGRTFALSAWRSKGPSRCRGVGTRGGPRSKPSSTPREPLAIAPSRALPCTSWVHEPFALVRPTWRSGCFVGLSTCAKVSEIGKVPQLPGITSTCSSHQRLCHRRPRQGPLPRGRPSPDLS